MERDFMAPFRSDFQSFTTIVVTDVRDDVASSGRQASLAG